MMKTFLAALATVAALAAPAAQAETLADALIAAYRNSNLLDQNQALLRVADEDVAVAVSALRPVISFVTRGTWARTQTNALGVKAFTDGLNASAELSASLTLLDFGRTRLAIDAAKESVLATRDALMSVEQQVLLDAVRAYVDVRLRSEIVALRNSNVRLITQELRAAQDRFEVGEVTRTDVAIAESRLASARAGLASAEGDLMIAREDYKASTGAYPGRLAGLPATPATARSMEDARSVALRTHPLIRQFQRGVTIAELNIARAKANTRPRLSANAAVGINDRGVDTQSFGLQLNQTLYAGGQLSALYRQSLARRDRSRAELQQAGVDIGQAVANAWTRLTVAAASIEAGDRQIRAAQTAFDGVREEATLGARTTLDVLDAEQELLNARATRLEAEATRYVGVYTLLSTMGLLTVEHLQLGVPVYDPAAYYNAVRKAPVTSAQGKRLDRILGKIAN